MPESNGSAPQGPPWMQVPAEQMIMQLTNQVAAQAQEMAAMRIYIDQLHQALAAATMGQETEDGNGAVVPTRNA